MTFFTGKCTLVLIHLQDHYGVPIILSTTKQMGKNDTFTRDILFTFNHAISDGFTAFHICNTFLKVLNDVIDGKVQESYSFGQLCEGQETDELMVQRMEYLHENPEYHTELQNLLADMEKQKIRFSEFFPVPSGTPKMTKHIYREIDEETNKKMMKVFKSKKLSLHSGFSAVANWALMELFTENGLTDERIDLTTFHMINLRRYWKKTSEIQLGPHVTPIRIVSPTDRNVGANLWQYAREFNVMLKNEIESKRGLDFTVVRLMPKPEGPNVNDFSMMMNSPSVSYYSTTNMGDLSSMLQGRGDQVSIKWLARCTSAHTINTLMTHIFQTYEGKFLYGLGYSTHIVRDDAANLYILNCLSISFIRLKIAISFQMDQAFESLYKILKTRPNIYHLLLGTNVHTFKRVKKIRKLRDFELMVRNVPWLRIIIINKGRRHKSNFPEA
ncbi:hypothetical protein Avbf_07416 [Armadillidium vulgare]|nr:hypothetical protein Avbf_07416 [Armadillidium vulgare]